MVGACLTVAVVVLNADIERLLVVASGLLILPEFLRTLPN